jgi:hypothetical protein
MLPSLGRGGRPDCRGLCRRDHQPRHDGLMESQLPRASTQLLAAARLAFGWGCSGRAARWRRPARLRQHPARRLHSPPMPILTSSRGASRAPKVMTARTNAP